MALARSQPIRRTRPARRRLIRPTLDVVMTVLRRDDFRCIVCGERYHGDRRSSLHHRRPRGMGGSQLPDTHQPQNLVTVCGADNVTGCHGMIHQRPSESRPNGWLLYNTRAERDPLRVAVLVDHGSRWAYLSASGEYVDDPPAVSHVP